LLPAFERLDNDHMSTTAWAWRASVDRFNRFGIIWWWRDVEQLAGTRDAGLARGCGEEAIVPDTVEASWQDVEQEASDKLVCCQRDDLLPARAVASIVFEAQGGLVTVLRRSPERLELAIGDRRDDQAFRRVQAGSGAHCVDQWIAA
jgi:hypothetical protein